MIASTGDGRVAIANIQTRSVGEFECPRWDEGGERLAVSDDGSRFYTAAYYIHGVTAWSAEGPAELWQRKDLRKAQRLGLTHDAAVLFVSVEGRGTFLVRTSNGAGCGH